MTKKLFLRLVPLMALAVSMQSCRTNEDLLASKEEYYHSNKFQVFTSVNNESIDYAKGFTTLFEKYDSIHGSAYARTTLLKKESFNKNDSEYVEFNLHSQTMLLDDGERWVIYPMITNRQVTGLMVGILSKDETEVEFRKLDSGTDYYNEVIEKFRFAFMKTNLNQRLGNTTSRCGYDGSDPCDIEEVVISAPPRPKPSGGGPKTGCTGLNNCFDPTAGVGGGGPGGNPPMDNDPCVKAYAATAKANGILQDPNVKTNMSDVLKGKVNDIKEWALAIGKTPNGSFQPTPARIGQEHSSTVPTDLLGGNTYAGDGHTHSGDPGAPSAGDFYTMLETISTNPDFMFSCVYGVTGGITEVYALILNDRKAAIAFLIKYPRSKNYDPVTHGFLKDSDLWSVIEKMKIIFNNKSTSSNTSGENYDSRTVGLAYMLEQLNAGMSIAKANSSGNLKTINASTTKTSTNGIKDEKANISKCP